MDQRLQSLVGELRRRPGMYLGEPSVIRLRAFLDGYSYALFELNGQLPTPPDMQAFRDWVYSKYAITESIGWEQVLVGVAGSDHSGFRLFEQLWDEFASVRRATGNSP